jgi:hypothetical protein
MKGRGQLDVYARTPLSFGFGKVVQQLGLYHGVIRDPQQLFLDLADSGSDDAIDMVILGTCDLECVSFPLQCFSLILVLFFLPLLHNTGTMIWVAYNIGTKSF